MATAENGMGNLESAAGASSDVGQNVASPDPETESGAFPPTAAAPDVETKTEPASAVPSDADPMGWSKRFTRAWRDTVGAYATDEGETRNLLGRLVDFGALSKEEASRAFLQMRERIDENRRVLDRRVDETLEHSMARLPFPTPGELQKLRDRVRELEARIDQLERS